MASQWPPLSPVTPPSVAAPPDVPSFAPGESLGLPTGMSLPWPAGPPSAPPAPPTMPSPPSGGGMANLLPVLFALGARMGGSPQMGTGILQGLEHRQTLQREEQDRQIAQQQRQQQLDMQAAQMAEVQRIQAEQRRLQAINTAADNLRQQLPNFKKREDWDAAVTAYDTMLTNAFGVRPHTLRAMVPFNAPDVQDLAAKALDPMIKEHGFSRVANMQAIVLIDRDGDGTPEQVPIAEALTLAGYAVATDPTTGKPMQAPVKPDNVQDFDLVFAGLLDEARAEKKPLTDTLKGQLALKAKRLIASQTQDPTLQAIRDLQLQQAQNRPPITPQQERRVNQLSDAFRNDPAVKRANVQAEAVSFVSSLDVNSKNPADDQALIYAFAKAMDPDSVVREGEYATVQKYAQSWVDNFGFNALRVIENREFLTPKARENMRQTIHKKYSATRRQYDNIRTQFGRQIERITGQPGGDDYLVDYAAAFPARGGDAPVTVRLKDGRDATFPNQAAADAFKRAGGG